jgi:hypothetical protein
VTDTKLESRGALQDFVSKQAVADPRYREALLKNPKHLMEKHLGRTLPDWLHVKVVEETADTVFLVAPHVAGEELSDQDLEMVAGGKTDKQAGGAGADQSSEIECYRNYGSYNSIINISSTVSY